MNILIRSDPRGRQAGKTPIAEAHANLRAAATAWLRHPATASAHFIEQWLSEADEGAGALFKRDGDWWREPE